MTQPWQSEPQPYGQQQLPPQPYGQQYAPQQPPPMYAPAPAPHRSQGLAITALVIGVIGAVVAFTTLGAVAWGAGLIAVILAIIALASKSQGGKKLAAGGLAAGLAAFPIAVVMYTIRAEQAKSNQQQVQDLTACIEADPDKVLECANLD
jgi:hypothetical protein